MQKWEIAGISLLPVLELVTVLNDYLAPGHVLGDGVLLVPESVIIHSIAFVGTVAALVRAMMDKRKAKVGE